MPFKITCLCGNHIQINEQFRGRRFRCRKCSSVVLADEAGDQGESQSSAAPAQPGTFQCPDCERTLPRDHAIRDGDLLICEECSQASEQQRRCERVILGTSIAILIAASLIVGLILFQKPGNQAENLATEVPNPLTAPAAASDTSPPSSATQSQAKPASDTSAEGSPAPTFHPDALDWRSSIENLRIALEKGQPINEGETITWEDDFVRITNAQDIWAFDGTARSQNTTIQFREVRPSGVVMGTETIKAGPRTVHLWLACTDEELKEWRSVRSRERVKFTGIVKWILPAKTRITHDGSVWQYGWLTPNAVLKIESVKPLLPRQPVAQITGPSTAGKQPDPEKREPLAIRFEKGKLPRIQFLPEDCKRPETGETEIVFFFLAPNSGKRLDDSVVDAGGDFVMYSQGEGVISFGVMTSNQGFTGYRFGVVAPKDSGNVGLWASAPPGSPQIVPQLVWSRLGNNPTLYAAVSASKLVNGNYRHQRFLTRVYSIDFMLPTQ